jgi:hypothetical protein
MSCQKQPTNKFAILHIQRKEVELQSIHNFYQTCKNSYIFWLYTCSQNQAGYKTWNNKVGTRSYQSRKEVGLQSTHNFTHTCKNSYMFRLYVRSHHQVGCETLNKKIHTTIQDLVPTIALYFYSFIFYRLRTIVAQWLRYCATNRKDAGSIPDGVTGIFH